MNFGNATPKSGHGLQRRHFEAVNSLGGIAGGGEAPIVDEDAHVREHGFEKRHYEEALDSFSGAEGDKVGNDIVREDTSKQRNCLESEDFGNSNDSYEDALEVHETDAQKLSPIRKRSVDMETAMVDLKSDAENGSKISPDEEDVQDYHLEKRHYKMVHSLGGIAGGSENSQDDNAGHQQQFERRHYE